MATMIEDRWSRLDRASYKRVPTTNHGKGLRWRARYVDPAGHEQNRRFPRKVDAQAWLDTITTSLVSGTHVAPASARMTIEAWCTTWIEGYRTRRPGTVKMARVHIKLINEQFGSQRLGDVRPSQVKAWTARMKADGRATSYVYAIYRRFAQIMGDAVHDGIIPRSPCSRKTTPGAGSQRPYVASTEQVWALYDVMPEHLRPAVLLGAFAGLRTSETCALRVSDVDFMRGIVAPEIQWPAEPLKSECSRTPVPIPAELALVLSAAVARWQGATIVADEAGQPCSPWELQRAVRVARESVDGLPEGFRYHDLRHYFASLLIASGLDVKVVQTRLRHASAMTTLNCYGHLWPDADESSRAAVAAVLAVRAGVDTITDTMAR